MKQARPYPRAIITSKAARALKAGHPWVFEAEVLRFEGVANTDIPQGAANALPANGSLVDVCEENGTWQGTGLLSLRSKIRIRLVSRNANDRFDDAFWARRIQWAWDLRKSSMDGRSLPNCELDTSCCRMIFSEADSLPGLIVDRYEDVLVSQVGTIGMERLRHTLYPLLVSTLENDGHHIRGIFERNDAPTRTKEGLELHKGWYELDSSQQTPTTPDALRKTDARPTQIRVHENGLAFDIDIENSQKTGFFLDQKYNRRAIRSLASNKRILDCFCHVGPFGLNAAAGGARFVRCVDISQMALDLAAHNADINNLKKNMGFSCANVLEYLPELARDKQKLHAEGGPFDLIILDPPAFTKSRSTIKQALRGYREINQEALKLLPRGAYLASCSCSHFMTRDLLAQAIAEAAHNVNVQLKQLQELQQAPDHPILWGVPQTHYLDFFIFQVV